RVPRSDEAGSGRPETPAPDVPELVPVAPGTASAATRTYFTTSVWRKSFRPRNTIACEQGHNRGGLGRLRYSRAVSPRGFLRAAITVTGLAALTACSGGGGGSGLRT